MKTTEVAEKLSSVVDSVSLRKGQFTAKRGYFYTHGYDEDKLAANIVKLLPDAVIDKTENHWHAWPKDSYWLVKFHLNAAV